MAEIEIRLPKMGESVTEATITNWLKQIGDTVALDEPLVAVATDKVDNELPSEAAGILVKQLFQKDEVAQVGDVIAILSTDGASTTEPKATNQSVENTPVSTPEIVAVNTPVANTVSTTAISSSSRFYSPLVKSIASQEGLSQAELDGIVGTGAEGRVTKKDILAFVSGRQNGSSTSPAQVSAPSATPTTKAAAPVQSTPVSMRSPRDLIRYVVYSLYVLDGVKSTISARNNMTLKAR